MRGSAVLGVVVLLGGSGLAACGGGASPAKGAAAPPSAADTDDGFADYAAEHGITTLNGGGGEAPEVTADGLRLERIEKDRPVKLDGVLSEWPAPAKAGVVVRGSGDKTAMTVGLQYDDAKLYVGAEITDPTFAAGRDHVSLVLAVPQPGGAYVTYELGLYAGKPGESEGSVRYGRGGTVPGGRIVEAPSGSGYTLEAAIPWGAIPEARTTRVGIHGVASYVGARDVLATGPGDAQHPRAMPWVPSEPELAMIEALLAPKGLTKRAPDAEIVADLTGDGVRERVAVWENLLTVCGSSYLGGTGYFYRDLAGELTRLDVRDVTGRGRGDVILRRRQSVGDGTREYVEVLGAAGNDQQLQLTFAHEIAVRHSDRHVDDAVRISRGEIEVSVLPATNWDPASYTEPIATDVEPVLLPWGGVKSQIWKWDGTRFAKTRVVEQREQLPPGTPAAARAASEDASRLLPRPPEPPTPTVTRGGDLSAALLDRYRKDRGIPGSLAPKVDLQVHVAGDARPERVLLLGRDIVVFGPGFRGGTEYAYLTLAPFADARDISDLSARDLTGDGAADLIVRGVRHVSAPGGAVESDVMLVYRVDDDAIVRIFGIETGRGKGKKHVQAMVQFVPSADAKAFDILAAPGRASGYTKKTYPWAQEQPGSGDLEPLLLPWGGIRSLRYAWSGTQFAQIGE
jgi:hypothetical protein